MRELGQIGTDPDAFERSTASASMWCSDSRIHTLALRCSGAGTLAQTRRIYYEMTSPHGRRRHRL